MGLRQIRSFEAAGIGVRVEEGGQAWKEMRVEGATLREMKSVKMRLRGILDGPSSDCHLQ